MSCISANDVQLARLADAIAQRVGQQRFHVWFNNSTRLDLRQDGLEIAVPNDFISEWIGNNFSRPIQEAAHEVLGCPLPVRFSVVPELFATDAMAARGAGQSRPTGDTHAHANGDGHSNGKSVAAMALEAPRPSIELHDSPISIKLDAPVMRSLHPASAPKRPAAESRGQGAGASAFDARPKLRHNLDTFIVGPTNQLSYNAACYVAEFPGSQYNPLFIHGPCGLGKTHLLQGICRKFIAHHPAKRWLYLTGEEFTNEFLSALRNSKLDAFRRKMRDLDLLVIDDVHFLGGKKATQEEFLHTFNAIEAMGKQVVMASDSHPKLIEEFGESLVNRFVSGMVVRVDPPNHATRCSILRSLSDRVSLNLGEEVIAWIARRVTQNVRELEGAITRISAHVRHTGGAADITAAQTALGDLHRQNSAPIAFDSILQAVCNYFGLELKDLMSGNRQRTISLARSVAMFLVRKTGTLSFPEIGSRMGKRNHSTVISACKRIDKAVQKNLNLVWNTSIGEREEEASELLQRLEEHSRALG
ncbi:MAG TPA: chromosomal replication initiator protein DnaA [Tepidisphaeraceae bacterium]|nr:chromosomal replication initiator protein DnaA [Tepidisphaeraceae bacterium]